MKINKYTYLLLISLMTSLPANASTHKILTHRNIWFATAGIGVLRGLTVNPGLYAAKMSRETDKEIRWYIAIDANAFPAKARLVAGLEAGVLTALGGYSLRLLSYLLQKDLAQ